MKITPILIIIFIVITACSKSDDNPPNITTHKIVGKWQKVAFMDDVAPFEWELIDNGEVIEFKMDGEVELTSSQSNCNLLTYQINVIDEGDDELNYYCEGELNNTVKFEVNANDELIIKSLLEQGKFNRITNQG